MKDKDLQDNIKLLEEAILSNNSLYILLFILCIITCDKWK